MLTTSKLLNPVYFLFKKQIKSHEKKAYKKTVNASFNKHYHYESCHTGSQYKSFKQKHFKSAEQQIPSEDNYMLKYINILPSAAVQQLLAKKKNNFKTF